MCNSPLISTSKITNPRNRIVNKLDYVLTRTRKTSVNDTISSDIENVCPIHRPGHSFEQCRTFIAKPLDQRRKILRDINICFECSRKNNKQYKCHLMWNVWSEEVHIIQHLGFEKKVSVYEMCLKAERIQNKENEKKGTQNYAGLRRFVEFQRKSCAKTVLVNVHSKDLRNKCRCMQWLMINQTKFQQVLTFLIL